MEHCKKLTSWDIYGVTKFPYRGRRKYSPGVQRSYYGIITITNDVFGLTILQFEREFKACLARRKKTQQRIQDIRYPDKTSCRYIDYLKYGDDTVEGFLPALEQQRSGINLCDENRLLYYNLIQVAATEFEIRTRQRIFVVKDNILNRTTFNYRYISSGSLAEGLYFPESDTDIMYENLSIAVVCDAKHINKLSGQTTLLMDHDERYPGFCKLKVVDEGFYANEVIRKCLKETQSGIYVSTEKVLCLFGNKVNEDCTNCASLSRAGPTSHSRHGPCISDVNQKFDHAFCLRSKSWPLNAMYWIYRHRVGQWPTGNVIDTIVSDGCLFVPIGPKTEDSNDLLWRISFSLAEKRLTHSMNYTQLLCYILLKLTLKNIINRNENVNNLLCSYFLKTTVFWISEETCLETFNVSRISYCFSLCIDKLVSFVRKCYCPNYFIPQHNLFIGKIDESNNKQLLEILYNIRTIGLQLIIDHIFINRVIGNQIWGTLSDKNKVFENLYSIFSNVLMQLIFRKCTSSKNGRTMIQYINFLMESESSEPVMHLLRTCHGMMNQEISQLFILQTQSCELKKYPLMHRLHYQTIRLCKKHLVDGTKADAVSGWLLYASFYYVLGHYKTTLQLVDYVLPRCTNNKSYIDVSELQNARESQFTQDKMRHEDLIYVRYAKQSTLIPQELQPEIQDKRLEVSPVVMSQCLQFLCYHHLGDVNSKYRILRELHSTVTGGKNRGIYVSNALVILGVCFELSENKDAAYSCYSDALRQEKFVCQSAKQRIENLFSNSDV